ncbi:MAG: tRNA guanosine(34) transglycosylase Tgt [Planctomycetes bacterium]|nr:tRNA guanosine(34) transglycosylase Tgt [Planctomycetota bacterium]
MSFEISARSRASSARRGRVTTLHGTFDTPAFMPVGTRGTIKGILPALVAQTGSQIVLNNTYHLMLRPGSELIQRMGGVHAFMNWNGPILTDSGGYQAFSLAATNKVTDEGVTFKSIVDGAVILLTPERAMQVQNELGPDIMMALDDCPPSISPASDDRDEAQVQRVSQVVARDAAAGARSDTFDLIKRLDIANERTVRWLERCKAAHRRPGEQSLFGIVQGGTDPQRRTWCAERVCNIDLPGYAIGGVAVGEAPEQIAAVVRHTAPLLPDAKPRYLMGVGYERDLLAAVLAGVDMFDCVLPTRNGRNANAFTAAGQVRLRNAKFAEDQGPIEAGCDCHSCDPARHGWVTPGGRPFSRGYLRHLFMVGEMLGPILVTLHNLRHFQRFMSDLRERIVDDDWSGLLRRWPVAAAGLGPGMNALRAT